MKELKFNRYTVLLLAFIVAYVLIEIYRPKPVDWTPTYVNKDKIPYGTFVLFELLEDVFPDQQIDATRKTPYIVLQDSNRVSGNYIFINKNLEIDNTDLNSLLRFVEKGNTAFIAAEYLSKNLRDSLRINHASSFAEDDTLFSFTNPLLGNKAYAFSGQQPQVFFETKDSLNVLALAKSKKGKLVFIKVNYGNGAFLLHSQPQIFTNFYLLKDKGMYNYAFKSLSYLPVGKVTWDEYFKQGSKGVDSILGVIIRYPALRWAYYCTLVGLLLFVLFRGKRRQRPIPLIEPYKNTSLEFAKVVSSLYFNQHNYKNIAKKKVAHFREFVHRQYHEYVEGTDVELAKRIAAKSGIGQSKVQQLLFKISYMKQQEDIEEMELHEINILIEEFYKEAIFSAKIN